jgi:hypothetical protein
MAAKTGILLTGILLLLGAAGCRGLRARSDRSFAEIQALARGKTGAQIVQILGEPDSRQAVFDGDERWIWWNYTFLDGPDCPPEMRGRVVHLEIVVRRPSSPEPPRAGRPPYSDWLVDDGFGITFKEPSADG